MTRIDTSLPEQAARATAPDGSTTSFMRSHTSCMAAAICSSAMIIKLIQVEE